MKKFVLKSGDKVWVNIILNKGKIITQLAEIEGFFALGVIYKDHPTVWHHYAPGLFYGFGYHSDGYTIVTKKKWHLYSAILLEKIRVRLSENTAKWLKLEN